MSEKPEAKPAETKPEKTVTPVEQQPAAPVQEKPEAKPAGKRYRYTVHCKGVGNWEYIGKTSKEAGKAEEAFLQFWGIVETDHPIIVGEPVEATE